ncbi:uncharacterized protein LOC122860250 [Aphidius gifuensis]|uniref:uncharacterized protein LOC122860250 n=1 Tax=Aphidius gifuensis TaxID=684658 RepID=UPI001CDCF464|nr:uncharacterized protein LOC122860250 [Aphidius gifuensis]
MQYFEITLVILVAGQSFGRSFDENEIKLLRDERGVDSSFKKFLEVNLRQLLREGNETLGLPIMDPFVKDESIFQIKQNAIVNADIELTNLVVKELSDYIVTKAIIGIIGRKITVGFHFPKIQTKGFYKLDGNFIASDENIHVFGDGLFDITFKNFYIDSIVKLSVMGEASIKSIDLNIHLDESKVIATGIFNDEETSPMASEVISQFIPQFIRDNHDQITSVIVNKLKEIGNSILKGKSFKDLLGLIG